jgi:ssDNA-binding Zn-finger/Zn-ribbon topoisomerase 1
MAMICPRCGSAMIVRTARSGARAGHQFWGCSTYPACRGIVDITESAPELVRGVVGQAGGSAQQQYLRRKEAFQRRRAERLPRTLVKAAVLGAGTAIVFGFLGSPAYGVFLGVLGAAAIIAVAVVTPPSTTAWETGALGEEWTARMLDPLAERGFVILHDRRIPGSKANIDHIAVGPSGVFVIETKNIAGRLQIDGPDMRIAGRRVRAVEEVRREASAVANALGASLAVHGLAVVPVICAHRAELPIFTNRVDGVRVVDGKGLVRLLTTSAPVLTPGDVSALAGRLATTLRGDRV